MDLFYVENSMKLKETLQLLLSKYSSYKTENVTNKQIVAKPSLDHLDYSVYLTTEQFDELHSGSCHDYTRKISDELSKLNIDNSSFFIASFNEGELNNSYSFILVPEDNQVICVDAFNKDCCLTTHLDEASAISYMVHSLGELSDYSIVKYNPEADAPDYNNSLEEFCLNLAKYDNHLTLSN